MKKHHITIVLLMLFFTGLIVLWWADYAGIETPEQKWARDKRILPGLIDTPVAGVNRVEIDRGKAGKLVFERRAGDRWQMREPVDAEADAAKLTTLVKILKDLEKSPDAGTIEGAPAKFGLEPPAAIIRISSKDAKAPLASLEVGTELAGVKNRRYVRREGAPGIEVVDAQLVGMVTAPAPDWRETMVWRLPSYSVVGVAARGPGRDLKLERSEGRWKLLSPVHALADDDKVEGVVAELVGLRMTGGENGFVADNARDQARYGLDPPALTIELQSASGAPLPSLLIGGSVPGDKPDLVYARLGDQDDVLALDGKGLRDLGAKPNALRSKEVVNLVPGRTAFFEVENRGRTYRVAQSAKGWTLLGPAPEHADTAAVLNLLQRISTLQASEFLEPSQVAQPGLDPPALRIKVWTLAADVKPPAEPPSGPKGEPVVNLRLGTHDVLKKTVYARSEEDRSGTVLALPDNFLDALPKDRLAFRDRIILRLDPVSIAKLTMTHDGETFEALGPEGPGKPNQWRLLRPVEARADAEAVTKIISLLANLPVERYVGEESDLDPKTIHSFGLEKPLATVSWTPRNDPGAENSASASRPGALRIGNKVADSNNHYARLDGEPIVFTVDPSVLLTVTGELHDHRVLNFPPDQVETLVLRWPDRALAFVPLPADEAKTSAVPWRPAPGTEALNFDMSRLNALVKSLSRLTTQKYVQYRGLFPESAGLQHPRLTIEVRLKDGKGARTLRIGNQAPDGPAHATVAEGDAGPIVTLSEPAWLELARPPRLPDDLPENVFSAHP